MAGDKKALIEISNYYSIETTKASCLDELYRFLVYLKSQNKKIVGLTIHAHGSPSRIALTSVGYISHSTLREQPNVFDLLEKDANIYLKPCYSNGELSYEEWETDEKYNIARYIATYAYPRVVSATRELVTAFSSPSFKYNNKSQKLSICYIGR